MVLKSVVGTTSKTQSEVHLKLYNRSDRPQEAEVLLADFEPNRVVVFTPHFTPVTCRLITFLAVRAEQLIVTVQCSSRRIPSYIG